MRSKIFVGIVVSFLVVIFTGALPASAEMYSPDPKMIPPPPISAQEGANIAKNASSSGFGAVSTPAGNNCFDYYHFQSVQVSVGTDKDSYGSGEQVVFNGELTNQNDYPIVDGYVFVRISRERANAMMEGNDVIDEIIPLEKVILDAKASKPINFSWTVPKDLLAGPYRADYFFSVGKKFNLGGLPFSNEVIVGFAKFTINDSVQGGVFFDRTATKVNGVSYKHIGNWPNVPGGAKVIVTQPLKNIGDKDMETQVRYDLYFWDSLNEADKIDSRMEKVTVPARSAKELTYEISAVKEPVYYLKITALTGDQKSIVNIRVVSDIERPRLNYPGITKFPLAKGDAFALFSCFHDTSVLDSSGKVLLTLSDKSGNEVGRMEYSGPITSAMMADKKDLTAAGNYDYLQLSAAMIDKNGKTVDSYQTVYDCSTLDPAKCAKSYLAYYIGGIIALILAVVAIFLVRKKKTLPTAILLFVMIAGGYGMSAVKAEAYNQKTATSYSPYGVYIADYGHNDVRLIASGDITLYHYVDMILGNYSVKINDPINFQYSLSGAYNATGGSWDTPNICQWSAFDRGQIFWCNSGNPPVYMTSNNPSVIACSGMNCTAKAAGAAILTANIGATPMYALANFEWVGNWIGYGTSYGYQGMTLSAPDRNSGTNAMNMNSAAVSWTVTVAAPPTVSITATPNPVDYNGTATLQWTVANATACSASGGWSGAKAATGGSEPTGALITATTYTITCSNTGGSASASVTVNVNPQQHMACQNSQCVVIPGLGANSCTSNFNCGGGGAGGQQHLDCVNNSCVLVNGTGYDKCTANTDCGGTEHSACVNKACVIVPGAGTNACRNDANCGGGAGPTYGICAQNACTQVAGNPPPGTFTCNIDADCGSAPSYILHSSNNLNIVVLKDNASYCSNKTAITAVPYRGFSSDIKLKVADFGGFAAQSSNFSINPLTWSDYGTGSQFSICMKPGASPGLYNLKIEGTGGNSVIVKLNVSKKGPSWQEVSLWRLLASVVSGLQNN